MKFIRFQSPAGPRWGRIQEDRVVELDGAPYSGGHDTAQTYPIGSAKLLPPVDPSKIICIGRNYAEHASERGNQITSEPMFFLKPQTALVGTGEAIQVYNAEHATHWEAELAVVIGKKAWQVPESVAFDYVFGYTIANDVSDRDYQKADAPFGFGRAKAFDTWCPCGPVLVTSGINPLDTQVKLTCNGEVRQSDSTALMVHPIPKLIRFLSGIMTLLPGDVILTGTPKGVGPMKAGDLIEITIPEIGTLSNPVKG